METNKEYLKRVLASKEEVIESLKNQRKALSNAIKFERKYAAKIKNKINKIKNG